LTVKLSGTAAFTLANAIDSLACLAADKESETFGHVFTLKRVGIVLKWSSRSPLSLWRRRGSGLLDDKTAAAALECERYSFCRIIFTTRHRHF
jgi:hypothetical protein